MAYTPTRLAAEDTLEEGLEQQVQPQSPKQKKPRKKKRWILLLVILAAILGVAAALAAAYQGALPVDRALLPDLNAKNGTLRADEPNADVPEGTYRFVVNQQPVMEAGTNTCNLELENVPANHFDVQCSLSLAAEGEEAGEELWSSHRLSPGRYIENVELNRSLEVGEYPLTLHYRFFDGGTTEIGSQDIAVTLYVQAAK